MQIEIDTQNDNPILLFRNKQSDRFYFYGELQSSDVAPGPVKISDLNDEEGDGKFFMFWIADCMSPPMYVVRGQTFEQAYEDFVDWQVDQLKIEDKDLPDYGDNHGYTSNGVPVDTEGVNGEEVFLVSVVCWPGDRNLWNLACMFLSQVTRYDNEYDKDATFRKKMAKCCSHGPDGHLTERAVEAWKQARNLSHFTF